MRVFENRDCLEAMKEYPDKFFDLAIVDPPYGINAEQGTNRASREQFKDKAYGWDVKPPDNQYFSELIRVSKNQIIWGANHFIENLPKRNSKHWIIWDKKNPDRCFADCEMAWCSEMDNARIFSMKRVQELNREDGGKIHPTQKPTMLYKWIVQHYAKQGDKILDTHVGSASSLIAFEEEGFDYVGFEIDKEYFDNANKRIEQYRSQLKIF
jgi:site-specific DNA-methyltransferase (adenine-specific)